MKILIILISFFYAITLNGQKVFLDEYKDLTIDSAKAKYYMVSDYEKNSKSFKATAFYITGEKESESNYIKSSEKDAIAFVWYLSGQSRKFVKDGKSIAWYKNGQIKSETNYIAGKINGKSFTWFENGKTKSKKNSLNNKNEGKSYEWYENGQLKSESDYIENQYNGLINTYWKNGKIKRKDAYIDGKFQNGTCYDSLGKEIKHYDLEVMPEYKGGDRQLLMDISYNTNYPKRSRDSGIQGRVLLRFAVNQQGSITDIEILEGINSELNKEAVRVLSTLKRFKPGYSDGEPVEVYYLIPITFTLK